MKDANLDAALLAAHASGDLNALIALYTQAADLAEISGRTDQACFFLTHAWIFALDAGDARAASLKSRLIHHGREVAL